MLGSAQHVAIDPEFRTMLESYKGPKTTSVTLDMIPSLRKSLSGMSKPDTVLSRNDAIVLKDVTVPGPKGAPELSLLVCRPAIATDLTAAVYYVHGGAMFLGDNRLGIDAIIDWVTNLGVTVISVQYRLAPEHPYPAPQEDCYAGLLWAAEHAEDLGIDTGRLLIAGLSAGGALAAGTALMARDRAGPALMGQMLLSPMLDDRAHIGAEDCPDDGVLDQTTLLTAWAALLGHDRAGPDVLPYAAPARETDLSRLPPTFIDVGSAEVVREETVDYAVRLSQSGGLVELHVWPGAVHGFDHLLPQAALSKAARAAREDWLRRHLAARYG